MLRLTEVMGLIPARGAFHYTDKPYFLTDDQDVQAIGKYIKRHAIDLVVFDTWARAIRGAEENDAKEMGLVIARLDQLRMFTGAALMIIAHTPTTTAASGSMALSRKAGTITRRAITIPTIQSWLCPISSTLTAKPKPS